MYFLLISVVGSDDNNNLLKAPKTFSTNSKIFRSNVYMRIVQLLHHGRLLSPKSSAEPVEILQCIWLSLGLPNKKPNIIKKHCSNYVLKVTTWYIFIFT